MKYELNKNIVHRKSGTISAIRALWPLLMTEKKRLAFAFLSIIINSILTLVAPMLIGHTIDTYIVSKQFHGVLVCSGILLAVYVGALISSYLQTTLMGKVAQYAIYNVRNNVFAKLQSLPIAFFNQNKAGDLISRINNDTDKLSQFLAQSLVQFMGSMFVIVGAGIFLVAINWKLGLIALAPALFILIFTNIVSPWVKRANAKSLKTNGGLSGEIQESIENFKVVVAFNRRDYFEQNFAKINNQNYDHAIKAGIANNIYMPVYGLASNGAQLLVLVFGIMMITSGHFSIGLLVSFIAYANNFYTPLRQIAAVWAAFQTAMAGWDRISDILDMESDLQILTNKKEKIKNAPVLAFDKVAFAYNEDKNVLYDVNFSLEKGKTYALVGPTGGGKTTTASLMARLFDPTSGTVLLDGEDIRSVSAEVRSKKVGFILQEPYLFSGNLKENILYGNQDLQNLSNQELEDILQKEGLLEIIKSFEKGLDTEMSAKGDSVSLGQKQLVAFVRAVIRKPEILILDEATANIDTVTEELLQKILDKLPPETTRVIIAHRLNTIQNADEIFFVNAGEIIFAGSIDHALEILLHGERRS